MDYSRSDAKAHAKATMTGIWAAALMPFTDNHRIDEDGFRSNVHHWTRELGIELAARLPEGQSLTMYGRVRHAALFYTGREAVVLDSPERLAELLRSDDRRYCIIENRDLDRYRDRIAGLFHVVAEAGDKKIISNRPD